MMPKVLFFDLIEERRAREGRREGRRGEG